MVRLIMLNQKYSIIYSVSLCVCVCNWICTWIMDIYVHFYLCVCLCISVSPLEIWGGECVQECNPTRDFVRRCVFVCVCVFLSVSRTKHSRPARLEALDTLLTWLCSSQLTQERQSNWVLERERESWGEKGESCVMKEGDWRKGGRASWEKGEVVWCEGKDDGERWGGSDVTVIMLK